MLLRELAGLLGGEVVVGEPELDKVEVNTCFAADLMSDVLAFCEPGALLLTGLVSIQAVQTANIADLAAVVFVSGKHPAAPVVEFALARGLPMLATRMTLFEACGVLHAAHLASAART
jgi:predicted transcriptional regulator